MDRVAIAAETGARPLRLAGLAASALGTQGALAAISAFAPPLLAAAHGAGAGIIGAALAVGPLVGLVVPGLVGALIDRAEGAVARRRAVLSGGAAAAVLGLAALAHAPTITVALVALACTFAGLHAASSAQRASVAHEVEARDHGSATAAQAAAKGVGAVLVLSVGSALVARGPAATLGLVAALLAGAAAITAASLRASRALGAPSDRSPDRSPLRSSAVRRLLVGHAALWAALHAMFAFTGLYVARELASSSGVAATAQATRVLAVFASTALLLAAPMAALARRVGGHRALGAGALALGAGLALALVAPDLRWAWPIAVLCGVGFAAVQVVPYPLLLALVPRGRQGALAAAFAASIEAPQLVALPIAGALAELTGTYRAVYLLGLAALLIGGLALRLHRAPITEDTHHAAPP